MVQLRKSLLFGDSGLKVMRKNAPAEERSLNSSAVPGTTAAESYSPRERSFFLFILLLVGTSNYVDRNIIGILLEPIKREFNVTDTQLGLLTGLSFALLYGVLGIPVARWADRGDRRLIITLALTVWSLMTLLCGMAHAFWQLAIARIGVGAGEAGAVPPAQSLIADYYPPDQRGRAIGAYTLSSIVGYILGLVAGGWIAQNYGWRTAFIAVGAPGLILAVIARLFLKEPRHCRQIGSISCKHERVRDTFAILFSKPSYRNLLFALILYYFMAYGALVFVTPFLIRVHGFSVAEAGATFGILMAIGGIFGNIFGGGLVDRLSKKNVLWTARLPGLALIAAAPLFECVFLAPNIAIFSAVLLLALTVLAAVLPAMFSALHVVCGSSRRATAVAIIFFFANLIGLGGGPLAAGLLSDHFAASYGPAEGLRYSLLIVMLTFIPSGIFMLRAAHTLEMDAED